MSPRSYHSPRRRQDAAGTRQEIVAAARQLFASAGYARIAIGDVAAAAGVSVKTVYASVGSKPDLLTEVLRVGVAGSNAPEVIERVRTCPELPGAIAEIAAGTRWANERSQDVVDILYSALGTHDVAEQAWRDSTTQYRANLRAAAEHLVASRLVRPGLGVDRVTDVLWLNFGFAGWRALVRDCGWSWPEAEDWLREQAVLTLRPS